MEALFEGAEVRTLSSADVNGELTVLMAGGVELRQLPKLAVGRLVVVPPDARRAAERAIEILVNTVAVAERCRRTIASPFPWVAFEATDDSAREWLEATNGIHDFGHIADIPSLGGRPVGLDDTAVMDELTDRWDGVALLAEAFAHEHPTGRLHELFRVFERAFALPATRVGPALVAFLHPRYGYTHHEVDGWIRLRDPATHADMRTDFVLEAEVRPSLRRMEQAALDVLLNKTAWRDPDPRRRDVWRPTAWTRTDPAKASRISALKVASRPSCSTSSVRIPQISLE